jgi:hypothetical protein
VIKDQSGTTVKTCTYNAYNGIISPYAGTLHWSTNNGCSGSVNALNQGNTLYAMAGYFFDVYLGDYITANGIEVAPVISGVWLVEDDDWQDIPAYINFGENYIYIDIPYWVPGVSGYLFIGFDNCDDFEEYSFTIPFVLSEYQHSPSSLAYPNSEYQYSPSLAYPNPVSDILTVDLEQAASARISASASETIDITYDVRLYNDKGNLLRQQSAKGGQIEFNVANLPNGMYYLHIYDGAKNKPEIQKILVDR